jgi:hypothetical protein
VRSHQPRASSQDRHTRGTNHPPNKSRITKWLFQLHFRPKCIDTSEIRHKEHASPAHADCCETLLAYYQRPRRQPAEKVAQHQLKENGPECCLTSTQDDNLIEPCACNCECMPAQLRCALTSLVAEKAGRGKRGPDACQDSCRESCGEYFAA